MTADAFWKMTDYHFAQGDALGYNMTKLGLGLELVPSEDWLWGTDYVSTEKSYDVLKTRAYFEDDFKLWGAYQPDARTTRHIGRKAAEQIHCAKCFADVLELND